ncbi:MULTISPECIES: hypothetical protein [unclassified Streptomyces]|uniref:hypothetical protein n=1 Tax=unclassified Streptomyces TaxID=2593676 RepID=UPI002E1539BD|nr:hypothetical protein OG457_00015 [Streptomyces sp. NBC_01207]WSR20295.1 hypothetical protein OG457_48065 [Streptomyces sp. NBC_01207]WTA16593.1 hypothetical protein OG365_00030 [Streptomyces sp. NBC_00853]
MLLQPLQAIRQSWSAKFHDFLDPDEDEIYRRCVRVALADPVTARLLGKRPGTDAATIATELRSPLYRHAAVHQSSPARHRAFRQARGRLDEVRSKHRQEADVTTWNWLAVSLLIFVGWVVAFALVGPPAAMIAPALMVVFLVPAENAFWADLQHCLRAARYAAVCVVERCRLGMRAAEWGEALGVQGARITALQLVRHRLGDDPDSLFISDGDDALGTRDTDAVVETEARRQLDRKLAHLKDGTIAVSGPRGSGKTTLLETSAQRADFGLVVQAPATYTPQEFLLGLSVRLCREYMLDHGYAPPQFTRASALRHIFQRVRRRGARLGWWTAFAAPACALLALGLFSSLRSLYTSYAHTLADFAREAADEATGRIVLILHGQAIVGSVTVLVVAIACWRMRGEAWPSAFLRRAWSFSTKAFGRFLILAVILSVPYEMFGDSLHIDLASLSVSIDQPPALHAPPLGILSRVTGLAMLWLFLRILKASGLVLPFRGRDIDVENVFGPLAAAAGIMLLLYLVRTPYTHALLAAGHNPLRLGGLVAGTLLIRASRWTPRKAEPKLVSRCRDHLYRLQTTQSTTHGLTATAQLLGLGSSHSTSLSTIPPNFPELVDSFRVLLADIAKEKHATKESVVIAIDEVDRLGTDTKALAFLSEIKAVLGVPHVHFLISIADDVGASFVRRGLPHRDVTDSSLDDIVHVQPATLAESADILAGRSPALTVNYAMLAHALSGGILRDLNRYATQIKEMQAKSNSHELAEISRHLILEELSETLGGFRTLLSKHQWNHDTSGILEVFRTLGGYLRDTHPTSEPALRTSLEQFAFHAITDRPGTPHTGQLADDAGQLIDEASAYAYFSLTLLDIFSAEGLDRRTQQAAEQGFDGDPERLAEARQELAISPYSARTLISTIRKAWSLPLGPTSTSSNL